MAGAPAKLIFTHEPGVRQCIEQRHLGRRSRSRSRTRTATSPPSAAPPPSPSLRPPPGPRSLRLRAERPSHRSPFPEVPRPPPSTTATPRRGRPTITAAATGLTSAHPERDDHGVGRDAAWRQHLQRWGERLGDERLHGDPRGHVRQPATTADATTVNLTSNSTGTHEFAATSGGTAVTSVTLPANSRSVTAYYGDTKAGAPTITAAATGLNPGTQTETITGGTGDQVGHHLERLQRRGQHVGHQRLHGDPRGHLRQRHDEDAPRPR